MIVNAATSVRCRYYFRFAYFLYRHGFHVIVYDYRGIGESRPATLRGFDATWEDWGRDFDAMLRYAARHFAGRPIYVVAHSIGGYLAGLAGSSHRIERIFTVGAQFAYWPDYAPKRRLQMLMKWHIAMPLIAAWCGYVPGKRLRWMEDTPRGVARDWAFSGRSKPAHAPRFASLTAPILAVSFTDDEFATVPAVARLLACFTRSPRTHLRISPDSIAEAAIGHFAFFHSRLAEKLWHIPLEWLRFGTPSTRWPGVITKWEGENGRQSAEDDGASGKDSGGSERAAARSAG